MKLWIYIQNRITCAALSLSLSLSLWSSVSPLLRRGMPLINSKTRLHWRSDYPAGLTGTRWPMERRMLFTFYPSLFFHSCGNDDQRAAEGRRQRWKRERRKRRRESAMVCLYVCVLPKYSTGTDLELAAGSQKRWFTHIIFNLFSWSLISLLSDCNSQLLCS